MATITLGTSPVTQLEAGASILAAACTVDTHLIKPRLMAFERAQEAYRSAHNKVGAAETRLLAAQTALGELDADQDQAVDAVARALIADGLSCSNPFRTFGPLPPRALMKLPIAAEAKAIHQLVAAIQRGKNPSKSTLQVVQALEKAARAVEQALAQVETLQAAVREARHTRDAVAQTWASNVAVLKRGARAASDDGAPTLYATLFERTNNRPNGKSTKTTSTAAATTAPQPAAPAAS